MEPRFTKGDLKVIDVLDDSKQFSYPYPVDENNRDLFNRNSDEGRANAILMTKAHKLYEALDPCIELLQELPTLNGFAGLAVLEYAKDVRDETRGEILPEAA